MGEATTIFVAGMAVGIALALVGILLARSVARELRRRRIAAVGATRARGWAR